MYVVPLAVISFVLSFFSYFVMYLCIAFACRSFFMYECIDVVIDVCVYVVFR